ncbi:MAG: BatA and WFA domain-containing protein [Bacteroidales bacterium]|nr:BatA and WFA domain-containing protein [Bacteroidales bacterium]
MIFANPIFLWGLLALFIPIAVHFFNFRRYRKVYFSNVDRLMEVKTEKRKVSQLRRWLVLLMRCLAIAALVLAFAQPTLPGSGQQLQPGTTAVSVYIDNSFSMENSGSDGSQLETAKQKAREIVAAYRPGDRFQLLSNTLAGEEFRWLSREEFLDAVDALQVNPASRRLSEVAQRQADFLGQSNAANCHAYIVSDFQTSAADLTQN